MEETKNELALEALEKINGILDGIRGNFPLSPQAEERATKAKGAAGRKPLDPMRVLKRVNGIIKNYHEGNAERKVKSLVEFLSGLPRG